MHRIWPALALGALLVAGATAGEEAARLPTLYLRSGDFVAGNLLDSQSPDRIAWQTTGLASPLQFRIGDVHLVQFPTPARRPEVAGALAFELVGGDLLYGRIVSLDDREAVLEVPEIGTLHVERGALARISQNKAADLIYAGPGDLDDWQTAGPHQGWRGVAGQLRTSQGGAMIQRSLSPPPLVQYEFELAWKEKPNFEFVFGYSEEPAGRFAFRIETWADELVVVRETSQQADVALLQKLPSGAGRLALVALFDETCGRLLIFSAAGEKLADVAVTPEKPRPPTKAKVAPEGDEEILATLPEFSGGIRLTNRGKELSLQRVTVERWNGFVPELSRAGAASISLADGARRSVEIRSFDEKTRQWVAVQDGAEQRFDEGDWHDVVLSPPVEGSPRSVRIQLASGARVAGELVKIEHEQITLHVPGVQEPVVIPKKDWQAVVMLKEEPPAEVGEAPGRMGRLEVAGTSLRGWLVDTAAAESAGLLFQARSSLVAVPLAADVSGRLVFRDAPPAKASGPAQLPASPLAHIVGGVIDMLGSGRSKPKATRPKPPGVCLLHLRSGDTLRCEALALDERGLTLKSAETQTTFIPHERMQALELRPDARPAKIEKSKVDRLLMLPRMQRASPPLHLIRSLDGDYLRGRLLTMDQERLNVEVRLEAKTIDRAQVSRILWLHPDETAKALVTQTDEPATPASKLMGQRVQAVPRGGNRLTFHAQVLSGASLSGESEVLGACQVKLDDIDQLLLGPAIEDAAATLAFHQWKLRPAQEPLPDPEPNADSNSTEGMESVLVGKEAPPIELDFLDGRKFKLADYREKIVVLDFWASWCGPCLQTMPQVDAVAREFAEEGVQLVAINLEETPDQVKNALARLKLQTTVALDVEGRVAEWYGATSIPQTVIIDRSGKVARLFVGGHARFDEQLRLALKAVLGVQ